MRLPSPEKIALLVAAAAAAISLTWFLLRSVEPGVRRMRDGRDQMQKAPYVATGAAPEDFEPRTWREPASQARGPEWSYDLFTPPEIWWDGASGEFRAETASPATATSPEPEFCSLEILDVHRLRFPLQLRGFLGEAGNWLGSFEILRSGDTMLLSPGAECAVLGLTLVALSVERRPLPGGDAMDAMPSWVARAMVKDSTGRVQELVGGEDALMDELVAQVQTEPAGEKVSREVRTGDVIAAAEGDYRIEQIEFEPAAVSVRRIGEDEALIRLVPRPAGDPAANGADE